LPSGLLLVLEQDPYAKTVGVVSVVRGGASADPPGAEGLAHLVEHLTFRAVDASPEKTLPLVSPPDKPNIHATRRERLIHHAAALVNGLTSPDAITFYEFAPSGRLPWLLDLEAARLTDPLAGIDQSIVALERKTIASEHELRDDPRSGQWASRQFFPMLFPSGHPYARAVDGTSKSRARLTLAEAHAFVTENFRPERMTLLVTAPTAAITLKSIVDQLPKSLVGDKNHPVKRPSTTEGPDVQNAPHASVLRLPSPLPVPQLWIGWTLPGLWGIHGPSEALLARWVQQDMNLEYLRQEDLFSDAGAWDGMELPDAPLPVSNVAIKKLPTGLTVIVASRRAASATAWLGFRGGYADSDPPLLLELALRTRPDAVDAAKVGALADRGATRDASIDILEFRPKDLTPALDLLFKKATAPVQKWPTRDDLDRMLAYVNADVDSASEKAAQAFGHTLFGDHPLARLVVKSDLARITRSDVDSWVGHVHNLRNAALVVVGDVNVDDVMKQAMELSRKVGAPTWVDAIPAIPAPVLRPVAREQISTVVTPRAGALTDVRLGCLLPGMAVRDRPAYEMLRLAMQERLSTAMRFERGEGYGVNVNLETVQCNRNERT
jgi:predicted Zn-dependent peptidase